MSLGNAKSENVIEKRSKTLVSGVPNPDKLEEHSLDYSKLSKYKQDQKQDSGLEKLGFLSPFVEELKKISFSEENFEEEMNDMTSVLKSAIQEIKAKRISSNTRKLSKSAQKFFSSSSGMRVEFNILGQKFSMAASGEFERQ